MGLHLTGSSLTQVNNAIGNPVRPEDYGAVGNGVANDKAALIATFAAAATAGARVECAKGATYLIDEKVDVPAGIPAINGNGATILITGINQAITFWNTVPTSASLPGNPGVYNAFQLANTVANMTIRGLTFRGQNDPFSFILGHQAHPIDIPVPATTGAIHDIVIEDCVFTNLWGASIRNQGGALRIRVRNNRFTECGDTVNIGGDYCEITDNIFVNSSVIESAGSHHLISGNIVTSCPNTSSAIAVGGRVSGVYAFGTVVSGNVISDAAGCGIVVADGTDGFVVANNTIRTTLKAGIRAVGGATNTVKRLTIMGNTLTSVGSSTGSDPDRIGIHLSANASDVNVVGNRIGDGSVSGYSTKTGIYGGGITGLVLIGNAVSGTALTDISLDNCPSTTSQGNAVSVTKVAGTGTTTYAQAVGGGSAFQGGGNGEGIIFVTAAPEGATSAPPATLAILKNTGSAGVGNTLWVKESGFSNTGWVPIGGSAKLATKTANYSLGLSDRFVIFNGTSLTATLPDPTPTGLPGRKYIIKNVNSSALTVSSAASKTIDGAASVSLAQWSATEFISDGTNWLTTSSGGAGGTGPTGLTGPTGPTGGGTLLATSTPSISPGIVNTATETSMFSMTVPAASVAAGDTLTLEMGWDYLNNSGSSVNYTYKYKLGATTVFTSPVISVGTSATRGKVTSRVVIALASLSDQRWMAGQVSTTGGATLPATTSAPASSQIGGVGTSAEDLSADKTLAVTITFGTAASTIDVRPYFGTLWRIR